MSVDLGTIIEDLKLMKGRHDQMRTELAKDSELVVTAYLVVDQLYTESILLKAENARLEAENTELRHHLNPAPDGPLTEAEAPY